MINKGTITH